MNSIYSQNYDYPYQPQIYEFTPSWKNSNLPAGSVTVGDYDKKSEDDPSSYLIDLNYQSTVHPHQYEALESLILSWINDSSDYDMKAWPEIEKHLKEDRLKLPND